LIRRHQKIDRGDHKQDNAKQSENQFHEIILPTWMPTVAGLVF
jgi:hypothetical protein